MEGIVIRPRMSPRLWVITAWIRVMDALIRISNRCGQVALVVVRLASCGL